jgi:hypothetical protein
MVDERIVGEQRQRVLARHPRYMALRISPLDGRQLCGTIYKARRVYSR